MTKDEYIEEYIKQRLKTIHMFYKDSTKFNIKIQTDDELKDKYRKEILKISKNIDWNLLNVDKKKFDAIFMNQIAKLYI